MLIQELNRNEKHQPTYSTVKISIADCLLLYFSTMLFYQGQIHSKQKQHY